MQNGGKRARRGLDAWDRVSRSLYIRYLSLTDSAAAKYDARQMTSYPHTDHGTVLERDRRLTGFMRGQTDKPEAPAGFELNNPWRVRRSVTLRCQDADTLPGRGTVLLDCILNNCIRWQMICKVEQYDFQISHL
jgi:hypothetical protein